MASEGDRAEPRGKRKKECMTKKRGKKEREKKNGAEWWPPRVRKEAKFEGRPVVDHQARDPEDYTSIPIARIIELLGSCRLPRSGPLRGDSTRGGPGEVSPSSKCFPLLASTEKGAQGRKT